MVREINADYSPGTTADSDADSWSFGEFMSDPGVIVLLILFLCFCLICAFFLFRKGSNKKEQQQYSQLDGRRETVDFEDSYSLDARSRR